MILFGRKVARHAARCTLPMNLSGVGRRKPASLVCEPVLLTGSPLSFIGPSCAAFALPRSALNSRSVLLQSLCHRNSKGFADVRNTLLVGPVRVIHVEVDDCSRETGFSRQTFDRPASAIEMSFEPYVQIVEVFHLCHNGSLLDARYECQGVYSNSLSIPPSIANAYATRAWATLFSIHPIVAVVKRFTR
jgi:hypothetical protein